MQPTTFIVAPSCADLISVANIFATVMVSVSLKIYDYLDLRSSTYAN